MLRGQSLIALLERHQFLRKSLNGLRTDMPDRFASLKSFYLEQEVYGLLDIMVNKSELMDDQYMIWVKDGELPHIFERKAEYSEVEARVFSIKTKIPQHEFDEIIAACN